MSLFSADYTKFVEIPLSFIENLPENVFRSINIYMSYNNKYFLLILQTY